MPEIKKLTKAGLAQMTDWFRSFDNEAEAVQAATESGEPFVWYHPGNKTYYVADKAEK